MDSQPKIISFDFEWIVYRKGSLHAHFQLDKKYLTWRDSTQWCNNFTRSLSAEQSDNLETFIRQSGLLEDARRQMSANGVNNLSDEKTSWRIKIQVGEETLKISGSGTLPDRLEPLIRQIEQISHNCLII